MGTSPNFRPALTRRTHAVMGRPEYLECAVSVPTRRPPPGRDVTGSEYGMRTSSAGFGGVRTGAATGPVRTGSGAIGACRSELRSKPGGTSRLARAKGELLPWMAPPTSKATIATTRTGTARRATVEGELVTAHLSEGSRPP